MTQQTPDPAAVIAACDIADARTAALPQAPAPAPDTLPQWLRWRFGSALNIKWDDLDDGDRSYWEHHAAAVRRAVQRDGFKDPNTPA